MSEPSVLDIDELLAPIPGDDPAGGSVPFKEKEDLETLRKEEDPDAYPADDPMRPTEAKRADWAGVVRVARKVLTRQSKDLLVAARLTEALTRLHGAVGLREGLNLLRRLIEECWDRLRPPVEDADDLEMRAAPFNWLNDSDRGALFPFAVRAVPLLKDKENVDYDWLKWHASHDPKNRDIGVAFEKALADTPRDRCEATADALAAADRELDQLLAALDARLGSVAPGMTTLRQALRDVRQLADQILARKQASGTGGDDGPGAAAGPDGKAPTTAAPAGRSGSRKEIYRRLEEAAAELEGMEPHSPIPYLIRRAVELGALPFPQLMRALIRDANVLEGMNRELGIKEPSPE